MRQRLSIVLAAALGLWLASAAGAAAPAENLKLPAVIGDHMVLQQGIAVPVWGWADAGGEVTVALGGQTASAVAGADGRWQVALKPLKAGGPLEMTVAGARTITVRDILVGEVWVCSGQSNMEMSVGSSADAAAEIAAAAWPEIRLFTVQKAVAPEPKTDCAGSWAACSPQTVGGFSAAGYFFGRMLHKDLKVPVGLVHTSWGGTPAESWTSMPTLRSDPDFQAIVDRFGASEADYPKAKADFDKKLAAWEETGKDPGNTGFDKGWAAPDHDASGWKAMDLPGNWETQGPLDIDGAVWFRREVTVPEAWAGKDLVLSLGAIDDYDTTYVNGSKVGAIGPETANWWQTPRRYTLRGADVKAGKAVIAVRVFDNYMGGGMLGPAAAMKLVPADTPDAEGLSLAGPWKYQVEFTLDKGKRPPRPAEPMGPNNPWLPTGLYNAMIRPLIPYAIRGAIWYQGESNADRAYQYRKLFPAMITDWRKHWGQGDFTFLFVQLANFLPTKDQPGDSTWAELREAQSMTLALPATGQAVIIDIGDAADIHPKNKQDVGRRLALAAEHVAYGKTLVYSGPVYESMKVEGGKVRLKFTHTGGGLVARGGDRLTGFAIAGDDKKFVWADAVIDGTAVLVSSKDVPAPAAVRYAWADNPQCNLYNREGLPASPFRTDTWPGVTANNR